VKIGRVASRKRPPRSAGSYGPIGVLVHPSRFFKQPPPAASQADLAAVRGGEARRVCCFLRDSSAPLRLRQGWLYLSSHDAQWKSLWSIRGPARQIVGPFENVWTRPADEREPRLQHGGETHGLVKTPAVVVVTCRKPSGWIDLAVPRSDVPLVVGYFRSVDKPAPRSGDPIT
jgi:hypothetical protein